MHKNKFFITIAGNIGVGKTTLTKKLSKDLGWESILEPSSENPYLEDFYQNMERWSFHSQLYFLTNRLKVHRSISYAKKPVIQDRSIYEDAGIFATNLYKQGLINKRDFQLYQTIYKEFSENLPKPKLVVYLKANENTLVERINKRNRKEEKSIEKEYLQNLNRLYDKWISKFELCPTLTIENDDLNIMRCKKDYEFVKEKILRQL